ncbi:tryptophan ABC transporter substrate-binding protein [Enterococcus timonensis]|uniref:tryptophan ABC transporter substrate-binding protein n=1 Tax=Enterococcus timonensis TaxID=1852364 RepID=UPI0008D8EBE8|nr:tryptophan ABC transporter substrate-binding protein [Enterococcus timonensis]
MREKTLYVTTFLLFALLIFASLTENKPTENEKPVIGILQYVSHPSLDEIADGIKEGLAESDYNEENSEILLLNAQGEQNKIQTMGQQLIQRSDVLIGIATPAAQGLANQTTKIPIVMGAISYPEKAGLVKDETQPDSNITGVSDRSPVAAQLDLMTQLMPQLKKIGLLFSSNEDNAKAQAQEMTEIAESRGFVVSSYVVSSTNDIKVVSQKALSENDALYLPTDNTIASGFETVVANAKQAQKPIFPSVSQQVTLGGLATMGINQKQLGIETGRMAAEILQGKKVADLPVYVFDHGEKIINEKVAAELGIPLTAEIKKDAQLVGEVQP